MIPSMMAEQRDLLRAICSAPDDDAPRLIYADWLEENDHADHADYIRRSIHMHVWWKQATTGGRDAMRMQMQRYYDLASQVAFDFRRQLKLPKRADVRLEYDRGFVRKVSTTMRAYRDYARRIVMDHWQPVQHWHITDCAIVESRDGYWTIAAPSPHRYEDTLALIPFRFPTYDSDGWSSHVQAATEWNRLLVQWAQGVEFTD